MDQLSEGEVLEVCAAAANPNASSAELSTLPLKHLSVWRAVAGRRPLSGELRSALVAATLSGPAWFEGQLPGETHEIFEARWALSVLSEPWLSRTALKLLLPILAKSVQDAPDAQATEVANALLSHPQGSLPLVARFLWSGSTRTFSSGRQAMLAELRTRRTRGAPWLSSPTRIGEAACTIPTVRTCPSSR